MNKFLSKFVQKLKNFWLKLEVSIKFLFFKEEEIMAVVYATLIVKGVKTFDQVPALIKEQVKQVLIDLEVPELAE